MKIIIEELISMQIFNMAFYRIAQSLKEYEQKRKFDETPEPKDNKKKGKGLIFLLQKHQANKAGLHYDLRLEEKGVLKSWAVRKGMPKKGEKHLAIEVEDHPISYADFEGEIPEGNYGAGKVKIDAKSEYKTIERTNRKWKFEVIDGKYQGQWNLINTSDKKWLLIKS